MNRLEEQRRRLREKLAHNNKPVRMNHEEVEKLVRNFGITKRDGKWTGNITMTGMTINDKTYDIVCKDGKLTIDGLEYR